MEADSQVSIQNHTKSLHTEIRFKSLTQTAMNFFKNSIQNDEQKILFSWTKEYYFLSRTHTPKKQ